MYFSNTVPQQYLAAVQNGLWKLPGY